MKIEHKLICIILPVVFMIVLTPLVLATYHCKNNYNTESLDCIRSIDFITGENNQYECENNQYECENSCMNNTIGEYNEYTNICYCNRKGMKMVYR